jgi:hypothetical protein
MRRRPPFGMLLAACLFVAATSRSDVPTQPTSLFGAAPTPEPITGTPALSAPGSEAPPHDPFTPYSIGDAEAVWTYSDLTAAEQAGADRGRDTTGWKKTHDAFASAATARARQAAASSAAAQLGIDNLAATGVVP